jgi:dTDP-4-dehydrorhamnose 3,5-epimerase-like enzyme
MPSIEIINLSENFRLEVRGWSFAPFTDPERIRQIDIDWTSFHTVSMEPGTIRGNHVHPHISEWLLFCGGPILLAWQDPDSDTIRHTLIENHHTLVLIPPGIRHAIKNLGDGILYLVAFRSPARNLTDPEVLPSIIIE